MEAKNEWLKPKEVQQQYKIGHATFWKWVKQEAFPVSRPGIGKDKKGGNVFVRRADVERFMEMGFTDRPSTPEPA